MVSVALLCGLGRPGGHRHHPLSTLTRTDCNLARPPLASSSSSLLRRPSPSSRSCLSGIQADSFCLPRPTLPRVPSPSFPSLPPTQHQQTDLPNTHKRLSPSCLRSTHAQTYECNHPLLDLTLDVLHSTLSTPLTHSLHKHRHALSLLLFLPPPPFVPLTASRVSRRRPSCRHQHTPHPSPCTLFVAPSLSSSLCPSLLFDPTPSLASLGGTNIP